LSFAVKHFASDFVANTFPVGKPKTDRMSLSYFFGGEMPKGGEVDGARG